ncbi:FecR family protein [Sphingomonas colocasiae]|uniref:FecR domain-containing protein n=1 Tax=Sphingomonas colocasiae TaxID=1848973 RepID=A0ABS7PZ18_9SPHN|nr:FecR domain-containing protein [Sphingomonas colocasiae]MBY8825587.1 FecR domain-containing protein [Sphingomonas colocasiae]
MSLSAREIEAEAARFVVRIEQEGRTPALEAEIEAWIGTDTRRRGALLQAEAAWLMLGDAGDVRAVGVPPLARRQLPRRALLAGVAGALAASFAGAMFLFLGGDDYETAVGEIRRVPLADGSIASINSDTRLAISFEKTARTADLTRGETWFQVAKDSRRPFTVEAGRVRVRAVGTAFSVRRREGGADVMVTEGVVETWVEGAEGHRVRLAAGERAFVSDDAAIRKEPPSAGEIDRALAWRSGRIDLSGESLDVAVAEFNRYNARKLVVTHRALGREPLYGMFRTDDPEAFAASVEASTDALVVERTPDRIVIGPRP